tara:strand:+ start:2054 stop:2638 length:585 start_codon:yes stop_codon:yes gene_type:complete
VKRLLCIFTVILLSSCVNHLDDAKSIFLNGVEQKSEEILKEAVLEADMITENHKDYDKAQKLILSVDSVLSLWAEIEKAKLKRIADSIQHIEDSLLQIDLINYPNMLGKWICYQTNYLRSLNSTVRIFKKGGAYYRSMLFDKDDSESVLKLKKKSDKRYDVIGKSDYIIINKDGDLEFWDKQGYFLTCKKWTLK